MSNRVHYLVRKNFGIATDENGQQTKTFIDDTVVCVVEPGNGLPDADHIILTGEPNLSNPIVLNNSVVDNIDATDIEDAYEEMEDGIVNDAAAVFKTNKKDSLAAFVSSNILRAMAPEKYADSGLIAAIKIGVFEKGDLLDTELKIRDYHIDVLVDLDIKRSAKIKKFDDTKKAKNG